MQKATEDAEAARTAVEELIHSIQYEVREALGTRGLVSLMEGVDQRIRQYR